MAAPEQVDNSLIGSLVFSVSISLFVASVSIQSCLLDSTVYCEKENS